MYPHCSFFSALSKRHFLSLSLSLNNTKNGVLDLVLASLTDKSFFLIHTHTHKHPHLICKSNNKEFANSFQRGSLFLWLGTSTSFNLFASKFKSFKYFLNEIISINFFFFFICNFYFLIIRVSLSGMVWHWHFLDFFCRQTLLRTKLVLRLVWWRIHFIFCFYETKFMQLLFFCRIFFEFFFI